MMAALKPLSQAPISAAPVGVGLRHEHYSAALSQPSSALDFVEIHAEVQRIGLRQSLLFEFTGPTGMSGHFYVITNRIRRWRSTMWP